MSEVLVTGGTGALGSRLVPRLLGAGHGVRVLSRRADPAVAEGVRTYRGDLRSGEGVREAVDGAEVIVHCASGTGTVRGLTYRSARRTDVDGTERLIRIAREAGSPWLLYISIVGIEHVPLGYYRAKLETEKVIEKSGIGHTIFRTTQWHTLAWEFCSRLSRSPVIVAPKGIRLQLLDADEVAERMADLVSERPPGHVAPMGGPEALEMKDVVRSYMRATSKRRLLLSARYPGRVAAAFRTGYNLALDEAVGKVTWEGWLATNTPT